MKDHTTDSVNDFDEPEGGWETGPTLYDTEVVVTTLCRFTGLPTERNKPCYERVSRRHPDLECRALYVLADALRGRFSLDGFDQIPGEVRRPFVGDELSGRPHDY